MFQQTIPVAATHGQPGIVAHTNAGPVKVELFYMAEGNKILPVDPAEQVWRQATSRHIKT